MQRTPHFECLFCRSREGSAFIRVEHVIPESLGNDDIMLPPGFVCDVCNQYFGAKIERIIADSPPFNIERTALAVRTKKGKLPHCVVDPCVFVSSGSANTLLVGSTNSPEEAWEAALNGWVVPKEPRGYDDVLARFLLKIGLELLLSADNVNPYSSSFDAARRCARFGERAGEWDVGWGIYPRRSDLLISSRVDEISPLHTHQIYQFELGIMTSGDVILSFVYGQSVFECNLNRPSIMEYLLAFNTGNEFTLQCRWNRSQRRRLCY